jgi:hypothetical protein
MPASKPSREILDTNGADSRQQNQNNCDAIYRAWIHIPGLTHPILTRAEKFHVADLLENPRAEIVYALREAAAPFDIAARVFRLSLRMQSGLLRQV